MCAARKVKPEDMRFFGRVTDFCQECCKTMFESKGQAKRQTKHFDSRSDSGLEPYRCPVGNGWHVRHKESQAQRLGIKPKYPSKKRRKGEYT